MRVRDALICGAGLFLAGPLAADPADFPARLDEAYSGTLTVIDGLGPDREGSAEVLFTAEEDGSIRFQTTAGLGDGTELDFVLLLHPQPEGDWHSIGTEGLSRIDAGGALLSLIRTEDYLMVLSGTFTEASAAMTLRPLPAQAEGRAERNPVFEFDFPAPPPVDDKPEFVPPPETVATDPEQSVGADDGGCREIEWRLVNRWNPFGGGLSLSREPFCVN